MLVVVVVKGDDAGKVSRPTSSLNNVDSDSELEDEDSAKPQSWISNTVYTSSVLDMIQNQQQNRDAEKAEEMESDVRCFEKFGRLAECFLPEIFQTTTVSLRSYDAALIEKATAACRLSNDIKRLRMELQDREAHIEFLREKHYRYKDAWKKELTRRERETRDLKNQLNQATSAKFIMFCKLQAVEVCLS